MFIFKLNEMFNFESNIVLTASYIKTIFSVGCDQSQVKTTSKLVVCTDPKRV